MPKIVVGPVNKGLRTDRLPFNIDNDSFPVIVNAYQWRGRVKRKRGTTLLGQLSRYVGTTDAVTGNFSVTIVPAPALGTSKFTVGTTVFTDPGIAFPSTLLTTGSATAELTAGGLLTIVGNNENLDTAVLHYPQLPVMGIAELLFTALSNPGTLAFDTTYSYNISTTYPFQINDVSFYKNPPTGTYSGYTQKSTLTPTTWNGQDYQQFWTANYQGALWATNGVNVPFSITNIGMQFDTITAVVINAGGPPASVTITTTSNTPLVVGDFVFINEINGITGINFQTGYVTAVPAVNQITVTFPNATIAGAWISGGIVQYLTSRSDTTIDCIRWYDGDPSDGVIPPTYNTGKGWVNYMPPLSQGDFSISELPPDQYYLVGCKLLFPFKDRMLFFGPVVQTSTGSPIYLPDTVVYTQNGTPYYTASYTNTPSATVDTPTSIGNQFNPILLPDNQTASPTAMFEDQVGFGGNIQAGVSDIITSIGNDSDALIVGFTKFQTRLMATGGDVIPFEFFVINSEYGSSSTFSTVNLDQGVLSRGNRGYVITNQTSCARFDLEVLDQVFDVTNVNNGNERFTSQRDFQNEWVYFTYPANSISWKFPNQTLFYNYRDASFAIFYESYTTYGQFLTFNGKTWSQYTDVTWETWDSIWRSGELSYNQPNVIAGNQQGFILFRETSQTDEATSLYIQDLVAGVVTSPNHNLNNGDFITISGAVGTNVSNINGKIFQVQSGSTNEFTLAPIPDSVTYEGGGYITRMYRPFIQTKQFPLAWDLARKTRIGPQQYLLTKTDNGEITVEIYLSQDNSTPYNVGPVPPSPNPTNSALIFSQTVHTCPESTNLGLTPFNTNLQMLVQPGSAPNTGGTSTSAQIWHRMNTSMIGDTVQLGFTLSNEQMNDEDLNIQFDEIELHGFIIDVSQSGMLS